MIDETVPQAIRDFRSKFVIAAHEALRDYLVWTGRAAKRLVTSAWDYGQFGGGYTPRPGLPGPYDRMEVLGVPLVYSPRCPQGHVFADGLDPEDDFSFSGSAEFDPMPIDKYDWDQWRMATSYLWPPAKYRRPGE